MKIFRPAFLLMAFLFTVSSMKAQDSKRAFSQLLQTYFISQDSGIVSKTISFLNEPEADIREIQPLLIGFFGALFSENPGTKTRFKASINDIKVPAYRQFFDYLTSVQIDSVYFKSLPSPEKNDMNWASFFATGNTRFLDNIISHLPLADSLTSLNIFFTGQTARWSLRSNALKYEKVNLYLQHIRITNQQVDELLKMDPEKIREAAAKIVAEQKAKGVWK